MDPGELPTAPEEFYRTLVENAAEGMLTIDAESRIVYANPAIEEILGYQPEELIGSSKMQIIPERLQSVHAEALAAYVETGERHIDWNGMELPALHKDGHEVPTLISLREHEYGGEQYFTGIIRDVSDRREREAELQAQKERLDQFADILAHDIRNPLSVAAGYTEIARDEYDAPELERVADALGRIEGLIDDVLVLSKQGQQIGETERVSLNAAVREAWDSTAADGATLEVEGRLGSVDADRSRFRELLTNLFGNAVEHGSTGSQTGSDDAVEHAAPDTTVTVGPLPDGFYVADDGPGVPEEIRENVFEHGYSTRESGTGFGLSIVRQIAEAHGWEISLTESEAGGARFEIRTGD
ncbi:two-component system sensor histidine kinase NtrB [Halolamina salifodinae]|uniref:histidine kinase n=1 Tax=Halolamina salifodinae TaxID=1202767 RepID=A0A8T4GV22_9EURY|nr:PAS domain-containing sensor histidine kinase [Halolamina salifodinae]MBP1986250.1 PAS domain S-box-containing protein [Halolamina salifodinae]